jgi:hypothetical protein
MPCGADRDEVVVRGAHFDPRLPHARLRCAARASVNGSAW